MQKLLTLVFLAHQASGVIYSLNLTEYYRMPELHEMEDYDRCLAAPRGLYCVLDADLLPGDNPELMRILQEYSANTKKHYNHTQIHRAVCVTETCKDFAQGRSLEDPTDLRLVLEECVNASIWRTHKLNAKVTDVSTCKRHGERRRFSPADYVMAGVYLALLILNVLGTWHDFIQDDTPGNPYLLAFSMRRNWRTLTAAGFDGPDRRLRRLRVFNGMRTLTIFGVFTSHTALVMAFSFLKNPLYFELAYDDPFKTLLVNGDVVTYTFFVLSGFLLAFNLELLAEKIKITIWEWPKGILLRWLRLTPVMALVLFTVMTVNRHLADGPQWELVVTSEADACWQYWWAHLLYINNYIYDNSHCLPQTWYLAADTQLFALGLLVCVACRRPRAQALALAALAALALLMPAAHTYFQDLDAVVYQSPELYRSLYKTYDTFRIMYVRAHTNMFTHVLGMACGLLAVHWFNNEKAVSERFQKYRWVIWATLPIALFNVYSGSFFYADGYEPAPALRVLYATLRKPLFQLFTFMFIMGSIFKAEGVLRGILEWRGFTWTARVSYCAFLLHTLVQRALVGAQRLPTYMSDYYMLMILGGTTFITMLLATLLWLCVEAPLGSLVKMLAAPPKLAAAEPPREETTKV
ncbi:nose resistant to fluoxetine protein 6-like [Leguminivora glycinivorella]|uniref:nose resistant to fluoxetine protein 6-like n=1 Tax=Leguminivora glycinivorella TaxID=1035111 RepID=UPI00200BEB57|nr:nose resistant to fluoxetine protein 6-like [Leguminivora glycinivorella]XP_047997357.1 nose resistant to fluoxetine protein 6-like [Leguminivora glycinivorella]